MLKIILFAYSKGITSSREIEWCCQHNNIFKALSCDSVPHFTTIAAFVSGHSQEMEDLFEKVLLVIESRYRRLGIDDDIYAKGTLVTADTGFANEANMKYLHNHGINGYIPDNRFRSRDPKFPGQKIKHGKRHQDTKKGTRNVIPASEFHFDPARRICICPAGNQISFRREGTTHTGKRKLFFEGRLLQCRHCALKTNCMENPEAADHRKGAGRQVSFSVHTGGGNRSYTDWMKERVDSAKGKQIYSHRMSVVKPVFGNIGTNKRLNRCTLRGRKKVDGQWKLFCMVHNIEKLANYGRLGQNR